MSDKDKLMRIAARNKVAVELLHTLIKKTEFNVEHDTVQNRLIGLSFDIADKVIERIDKSYKDTEKNGE